MFYVSHYCDSNINKIYTRGDGYIWSISLMCNIFHVTDRFLCTSIKSSCSFKNSPSPPVLHSNSSTSLQSSQFDLEDIIRSLLRHKKSEPALTFSLSCSYRVRTCRRGAVYDTSIIISKLFKNYRWFILYTLSFIFGQLSETLNSFWLCSVLLLSFT